MIRLYSTLNPLILPRQRQTSPSYSALSADRTGHFSILSGIGGGIAAVRKTLRTYSGSDNL